MVRLVSAEGLDEATLHKYEMGFFSEETRRSLGRKGKTEGLCIDRTGDHCLIWVLILCD